MTRCRLVASWSGEDSPLTLCCSSTGSLVWRRTLSGWYSKQVQENTESLTRKYSLRNTQNIFFWKTQQVLRKVFTIHIFYKKWFIFVSAVGSNPKPGKGTHIQCLLQSERRTTSSSEWTAVLKSRHKENSVVVSVTPPADCIVAEWRLTVENIVSNSVKPRAVKYTLRESIFILFNPWCRGTIS